MTVQYANSARARLAIANRFALLLQKVLPSASEQGVFRQHQASIRSLLSRSFSTSKVELIGSYARGTQVAFTSDIDLLLVLRKSEVLWGGFVKSSATVLANVRSKLQGRYVHTEVKKDGQAVVCDFKDGQYPVDIVPSYWERVGPYNYPLYRIPDGQGGWNSTTPQLHNRYISNADAESGGKLKNVARLLKYWSNCRAHAESLSGFRVELLLASERTCVGAKGYSECLAQALTLLSRRGLRAIQDPLRVSSHIGACKTDSQRLLLEMAVSNSAYHAWRAIEAQHGGDTQEAVRQWDIVFNGYFPK